MMTNFFSKKGFNLNFKNANNILILIGKNMKIIGKIRWHKSSTTYGDWDWDFHPHFNIELTYAPKLSTGNDIKINVKGLRSPVNFLNFINSDSTENIKLGFEKFVKTYESLLLFS